MRTVVLEYHDVIADSNFDGSGFPGESAASYKMHAVRFASHLKALHAAAAPVVTVADSVSHAAVNAVLFTFDDGGVSAYSAIAPMLESFGWRGHFFVTTDHIGRPGFLSADQIVELHRRRHVIGSHSASHPVRMARCKPAELHREWRHSVDRLSEILGAAVTVASVPGGYYAEPVARAAAEEGIRTLFTSEPTARTWNVAGCEVFGRFTLRRGTSADAVCRLVGRAPTARAAQWMIWNMKRVGKTLGGSAYLRVRALALGDRRSGESASQHPG